MPKKMSFLDFVYKANSIHGNNFDYSFAENEYVNASTKIHIKCNKCGNINIQIPSQHLNGRGCINCMYTNKSEKLTKTFEWFLKKATEIHNNKYNYELAGSIYKNTTTKIPIFCKNCKTTFEQTPAKHLSGQGCPKCRYIIISNKKKHVF